MKVVIVGAGIMGLSVARAMLRDGHQVTVFDQGPVPNTRGSSVDRSRLIRWPYGAMTGYMHMVREAYEAWQRVWDDIGDVHYAETGTLMVDRTAGDWVTDSVAAMTAAGIPHHEVAADKAADRYPYLNLAGARAAYFVPQGGVLLAGTIVDSLAGFVSRHGGVLEPEQTVVAIDPERGSVTLADDQTVAADAVVVAAGPWTGGLFPQFAARLTPSRQVVAYLDPPQALDTAWQSAPMLLDINDDGGAYVVPPVLGAGPKIGDHTFSMTGDPDHERTVSEFESDALIDFARPLIHDLDDYRVTEAKTCFYTMAPEQRFIVEPVGKAWVMAGFSGHGFKFGPILGEAVADTVAGRRDASDLAAWAAGRASDGGARP